MCLSVFLEVIGGIQDVPSKPQVYTFVCDVSKRESVYRTAEKVRAEVGNIDFLINNAGVVSGHHLLECPDELIERTMKVNCHAHFWVGTGLPTKAYTCHMSVLTPDVDTLNCAHTQLQ